jgi:hypothetical protein
MCSILFHLSLGVPYYELLPFEPMYYPLTVSALAIFVKRGASLQEPRRYCSRCSIELF